MNANISNVWRRNVLTPSSILGHYELYVAK
jgi:hypothetical protein